MTEAKLLLNIRVSVFLSCGSFTKSSSAKMVRLNCFALFILCLSGNACGQLSNDEINVRINETRSLDTGKSEALVQDGKSLEKSEALVRNFKDVASDFVEDDLVLLPQQRKMMFDRPRLIKKEITYEMYQWPKNYEGFVIVPYLFPRFSGFSEFPYLD